MNKLLDQHQSLRQKIFDYFGYAEDWCVYPINDSRDYFWRMRSELAVCFADTEAELENETGNYYENEVYTQRFLSKWVYRADDYTMILVDTHTDGNKFLSVFANVLERNQKKGAQNERTNLERVAVVAKAMGHRC